jgi:AcrR family transcriptional regulator
MAKSLSLTPANDSRPVMSLREKQKNERCQRILDAAEALIRGTASIDFTMRQLAAAAEVSLATPFNLFGSKEGLLYALLTRSLDDIIVTGLRFREPDPMTHVIEAGENAVRAFLDDPDFLRPLYQVLLSVSHPAYRPDFMARTFAYWHAAARTIPQADDIPAKYVTDAVASALMAHFIGLLELWVHRDVDDRQFLHRAKSGIILIMLPMVPDALRCPLETTLAQLWPQDDWSEPSNSLQI